MEVVKHLLRVPLNISLMQLNVNIMDCSCIFYDTFLPFCLNSNQQSTIATVIPHYDANEISKSFEGNYDCSTNVVNFYQYDFSRCPFCDIDMSILQNYELCIVKYSYVNFSGRCYI